MSHQRPFLRMKLEWSPQGAPWPYNAVHSLGLMETVEAQKDVIKTAVARKDQNEDPSSFFSSISVKNLQPPFEDACRDLLDSDPDKWEAFYAAVEAVVEQATTPSNDAVFIGTFIITIPEETLARLNLKYAPLPHYSPHYEGSLASPSSPPDGNLHSSMESRASAASNRKVEQWLRNLYL